MYQWEQEMSRVDTEQLPDRRHLQSAQARLWCVNYSINQHMVLSRCQHLITCETLPVNGVKCVRVVWGWQVTHHVTVEASSPSEPPWHSHSICVAYVCESHRRRGRCSLLSSLYFFFLFATSSAVRNMVFFHFFLCFELNMSPTLNEK